MRGTRKREPQRVKKSVRVDRRHTRAKGINGQSPQVQGCNAGRNTDKKWTGKPWAVLQEQHTEAQQRQLRRQKHKATPRKHQVFSNTTGVYILIIFSAEDTRSSLIQFLNCGNN